MSSTDFSLPTKACHNCRKRRWKCDRSLPVCQKCLSSGSECLGYGKLFVWNQGVASRGKMMGKTYEARLAREMETKREAKPQALQWQIEPPQTQTSRPSNAGELHRTEEEGIIELPNHQEPDTAVPWPLVDPLFKDLNHHSRYYLFHFATQLCGDMVTYDGPGKNPIRDLIPATSAYPLLLHIIEANSAFHLFNISRDPMIQSTYQHQEQRPCLIAYYKAVSRFGGPLKSAYHDALIAKQQALSLLAQNIASVKPSNIDLILVTILLFINYALVESGRDKWKVHMDGARRLIGMLGEPPYVQNPMTTLRQTILSDFLVFHILGTTLCFSTMPKLIPDSIELEPILRYAETNNYLSCPGPLLRIMNESFNLRDTRESAEDDIPIEMQAQVGALLRHALEFDPTLWALDFEPASPLDNIELRMRMASAHRSAVCIYLARVLPSTNPLLDPNSGSALVSLTGLADDVVHHISYLKPGDVLFKSICWPLFLAGAESEDPVQREWIMNTLDSLFNIMYWGYIPTVKRVLEAIWSCKDKAAAGADNCWVVEVKEMTEMTDILIV